MATQAESAEVTDRIVKRFEVNAPRSRVWRALSDSTEFGTWFGMKVDRPFTPGASVIGQLLFTGLEHVKLEMRIERMDPESYFSYRWHPFALDTTYDYDKDPMTLVEFRLESNGAGTVLHIIESGFDMLPANRRVEAFRMNDGGWMSQAKKLLRYVE